MPTDARQAGTSALRRYWAQWTKTIAAGALRRGGLGSDLAHADLYRRLLATCRALSASSLGADKEYYDYLESLVSPWGSLDVLTRTDRDLLYDLLMRCQEAEKRLGCGGESVLLFLGKLLAGAATGVMVAIALVFLLDRSRDVIPYDVMDVPRALWQFVTNLGDTAKFLLAGGILTGVAMLVMIRTARR